MCDESLYPIFSTIQQNMTVFCHFMCSYANYFTFLRFLILEMWSLHPLYWSEKCLIAVCLWSLVAVDENAVAT